MGEMPQQRVARVRAARAPQRPEHRRQHAWVLVLEHRVQDAHARLVPERAERRRDRRAHLGRRIGVHAREHEREVLRAGAGERAEGGRADPGIALGDQRDDTGPQAGIGRQHGEGARAPRGARRRSASRAGRPRPSCRAGRRSPRGAASASAATSSLRSRVSETSRSTAEASLSLASPRAPSARERASSEAAAATSTGRSAGLASRIASQLAAHQSKRGRPSASSTLLRRRRVPRAGRGRRARAAARSSCRADCRGRRPAPSSG